MKRIKQLLKTVAKCLVGLTMVVACGDAFHDEFVRPAAERSLILLAVLGTGVVVGGLIMPYAGEWLERGVEHGLALGAAGRRAYDGQVVPKDDVTPPEPGNG
jgi:hypothetical protein